MTIDLQTLVANAAKNIQEITPEEANAFIKTNNPFVVDVREPAELVNGFIEGADNIPRGVLEFKIGNHQEVADKLRPVLVYCQTGMRGALATLVLNELGYTGAVNLKGGMELWLQSGFPAIKDIDSW